MFNKREKEILDKASDVFTTISNQYAEYKEDYGNIVI
jgi:hypothetical protein